MNAETLKHLSKNDVILRRVIKQVGPCTLLPELKRAPYESLIRAVAHQQSHGKAAETITKAVPGFISGKAISPA